MHNAPAVIYPVGRSRWQLLVIVVMATLAATLILGVHAQLPTGFGALLLVLTLLLAATALWAWYRGATGQLSWDGKRWCLHAPDRSQHDDAADGLQVHLDFQFFMLVSLVAGRQAHWLWLQRSQAPMCWLALRRAAFARVRAEQEDTV